MEKKKEHFYIKSIRCKSITRVEGRHPTRLTFQPLTIK